MLLDSKPLPEPMFTKVHEAIQQCGHMAAIGHNELNQVTLLTKINFQHMLMIYSICGRIFV